MTSHDVVDRVREVLRIKKVGHGGTLDPLATGVLVVAIGRATKFLSFLELEPKKYLTRVVFGVATDTLDSTGRITWQKPFQSLKEEQVGQILQKFHGEITQVPPAYSAIKMDGVPIYRLARQGIEVNPKPRRVKIFGIGLKEFIRGEFPQASLEISCSGGTYVRSLAADIGKALGTEAHVTSLRRLQVGRFLIDHSIGLKGLTPEMVSENLISLEEGLSHYPSIKVKEQYSLKVRRGCPIKLQMIEEMSRERREDRLMRVNDNQNSFLGLIKLTDGPAGDKASARFVLESVRMR